MKISRRDFIKVSTVASATLASASKALSPDLGLDSGDVFRLLTGRLSEEREFHLLGRNLLNLHFYFINVNKKGSSLVKAKSGEKSFMIVRLPQQFINETGFWAAKPGSEPILPQARLSGFSYLAFQLWPDNLANRNPKLKFSLENILDWNDQKNVRLITLVDWLELKGTPKKEFDFVALDGTSEVCENFKSRKIWSPTRLSETTLTALEPRSAVFHKFKSIIQTLLDKNVTRSDTETFIPTTFFELPNELCLVPTNSGKKVRLDKNVVIGGDANEPASDRFEIWNNTLVFEAGRTKAETATVEDQIFVDTPSFRAAGLILEDLDRLPACSAAKLNCDDIKEENMLPTLLTKAELVYLTQFAKGEHLDFTNSAFEIREQNGLFFTGLGAIAHLQYENVENKPAGISLIKFRQLITQGRILHTEVARLGFNAKTGQRYMHVIEGKRKIGDLPWTENGRVLSSSFIELKQYCLPIDRQIRYDKLATEEDWGSLVFHSIPFVPEFDPIIGPALTNSCHPRRFPFSELSLVDPGKIPVDCLRDQVSIRDVCELEKLKWFWPVREGVYAVGTPDDEISLQDYISCDYEAKDWEGNSVLASTPFMFIRDDLVEATNAQSDNDRKSEIGKVYDNYFRGTYSRQSKTEISDPRVERRKTFFQNQIIAYTPSLPQPGVDREPSGNEFLSKTNFLETREFETYFNVTIIPPNKSAGYFPYVIFPQMLRTTVFVDHIRDLTKKKISSVVEYHPDYISHEFGKYELSGGTKLVGNGARLILQNTGPFKRGEEETSNDTYKQISEALQQAKAYLGNIAVPDIVPDAISLDENGITLPPDFKERVIRGELVLGSDGGRTPGIANTSIEKLKDLDPKAIFRGKFSELMGLDLIRLLEELIPVENSPLFEIEKFANRIEEIASSIESEVYTQIKAKFADVESIIKSLKAEVERLETLLNVERQNIQKTLDSLKTLKLTADLDTLQSLVKTQLEYYKTQGFEVLLDGAGFNDVKSLIDSYSAIAKTFIEGEVKILESELEDKKAKMGALFGNIKAEELENLPASLRNIKLHKIEDYFLGNEPAGTLRRLYHEEIKQYSIRLDHLFKTSNDNKQLSTGEGKQVYFDSGSMFSPDSRLEPFNILRSVEDSGLIQVKKKVADLNRFIACNADGTKFQREAVVALQVLHAEYTEHWKMLDQSVESFQRATWAVAEEIREWKSSAERALARGTSELTATQRDVVERVQETVLKVDQFLDFARKFDPYFYYQEQERIRKEILDIRGTFNSRLHEAYTGLTRDIKAQYDKYEELRQKYIKDLALNKPVELGNVRKKFVHEVGLVNHTINNIPKGEEFLKKAFKDEYAQAKIFYDSIKLSEENFKIGRELLKKAAQEYAEKLKSQASNAIDEAVRQYIDEKQTELENAVGNESIKLAADQIKEARNIYTLLTSLKKQELTYKWNTSNFRDAEFGVVTFKKLSNPNTNLTVDVRTVVHFAEGVFPPVVSEITNTSKNTLTNFGIGFFEMVNIVFERVSFSAGSGESSKFDVKIKHVEFEGALSFVQAFESYLKTLGVGLILAVRPDHASLGYSLPLPAIQTPGFAFFNLSLNFDLKIYFDNRPMRFGFSLATPEEKFGIAVNIYAGFGFFGLVVDTKRGIVEIDCALEAGVWSGLRFGPFSGEAKLAFGFRYTKNDFGVRLEGYIVAEGRLKVWILEVGVRIYIGVVSQNSYVEGSCSVTHSAKIGFIRKKFTSTYTKRISGAQSSNTSQTSSGNNFENAQSLVRHFSKMEHFYDSGRSLSVEGASEFACDIYMAALDKLDETSQPIVETEHISQESWIDFITVM
ncbi:MAG: twin-arginine translocation signal domain-containing protein [Chloracidobacterium sp.]|nr:twin-arginine translocation signal domain-containing protein [Chloracidobacterium sp.]